MAIGDIIWTYFNGTWHQGDLPVMNAADHGTWFGSLVFDGARAFNNVVPDLMAHLERVNNSARVMGMTPTKTAKQLKALTLEGLEKFAPDAPVYIRPMYWSREGGVSVITPGADSTAFCLCLEQVPMPPMDAGQTLCRTQFIRPMLSMAPVNAKAACLYPNNGRMVREALARGYNNALVADPLGNVAETASSNIFMVKDGLIRTPVPNGTFLNGITRQRIITLLDKAGRNVEEATLSFADFEAADEVFMTGNMAKITPVVKFEDTQYAIGPVTKLARKLYWEWAGA